MHCMQSNFGIPIKYVRSLDLFDGTPESPRKQPHKSRRTLMSQKPCEIALCSPNQIEMTPDSPVLAPEVSPIPHYTRQEA